MAAVAPRSAAGDKLRRWRVSRKLKPAPGKNSDTLNDSRNMRNVFPVASIGACVVRSSGPRPGGVRVTAVARDVTVVARDVALV